MYLIFLSLAILIAYLTFSLKVIGIPYSISDTYYQLKKANEPYWLFQVCMVFSAGILLPAWVEMIEDTSYTCCAFLACVGLIFVGMAPSFKLELEGKVHIGGTIICGLASVLYMIFSGYYYIPLILLPFVLSLIFKYKKPMFWIELYLFLSTYLSLIINSITKL